MLIRTYNVVLVITMGLCFSFCLAETPSFEQNVIRQKLNIARVIGCLF